MIVAPVVLSIVPPLMTNAPAAVPSADALLMFNVPAFSVTPPVKVLAPGSVSVPAPAFTTELAVAPLAMTPPSVSVPALAVIVRLVPAAAPNVLAPMPNARSCVVPAPPAKTKSPLIVIGLSMPAMAVPVVLSIVPPLMTNSPVTAPNADALLMFNVPAFSVTPPENEFAAESVRTPAPFFVRAPIPVLIIPPIATSPPPAEVITVRLLPVPDTPPFTVRRVVPLFVHV